MKGILMDVAQTLPHASTRPSLLPRYYIIFLTSALLPGIAIILLLLFFVPRFAAIFAQFGVQLPALTAWILDASHLAQNWVFLLVPLGLILLCVFPFLPAYLCARREDSRRRGTIAMLLILLHVFAFLLVLFVIFVAMMLPVLNLQQRIH
jgi:type II secretory pathway component PulF